MNADNVQGAETVGERKAGDEPQGAPVEQVSESLAEAAPPVDLPEPSIQETLLEGVSANALAAVGAGEVDSGAAAPAEPVTATSESAEPEALEPEALEPVTVASESGAPAIGEPEAVAPESEPAPLAEDLTVVPEAAAEPAVAVETASAFVETITQALPESLAAALPETVADLPEPVASLSEAASGISEAATRVAQAAVASLPVARPEGRTLLDLAKAPPIAGLMDELGAVNATVLTYLRGEGAAALAHWQALSGARTPADALRLQVDEMQRAADASLNCFSAIAQRASRLTATIGRP